MAENISENDIDLYDPLNTHYNEPDDNENEDIENEEGPDKKDNGITIKVTFFLEQFIDSSIFSTFSRQ
jgi:hypothetical protein